MKIVLIQPRSNEANPNHIHEPLNLGYLAASLIQEGFNDVSIVVGAFAANDEAIIKKARQADIIGFTATSPMVKKVLRLATVLKDKGRLVIMGGTHASNQAEDVLNSNVIDAVVRGEGERALVNVVQRFSEKKDWRSVSGVSYKNGGRVIHNRREAPIDNLDILPFPARDLYSQERFLDMGHQLFGDRGAWILASRGCPQRCIYCASHEIWGRSWRCRSAENVVKEIRQVMADFNVNRINFADDNFSASKASTEAFCRAMMAKRVAVDWGCNVRVDTVDRPLLRLMKSAGCKDIWIGVESGSSRILKFIKKDVDLVRIKQVFRWAREEGLKRRGYFMLGIPGETLAEIRMTEKLVEELEPDSLAFTFFVPFPGSVAFKKQRESGVDLARADWSGVDFFKNPFAGNEELSVQELQAEHGRLFNKFKSRWKK